MQLPVRFLLLAAVTAAAVTAGDAPDGTTFTHPVLGVDGPDLVRIKFCGVPLQVKLANLQLKDETDEALQKFLKDTLRPGSAVRIELEPDLAGDGPGAVPAHVFAGATHINLEAVKRGMAVATARSRKFTTALQAAQVDAMTNKRGLWSKETPAVAVKQPDPVKKPEPFVPAEKLPEVAPAGYKGAVVADLTAKEYHYPGSRYAQSIRAGAKIEYKSTEEAERAGKQPSPFSFPDRAREMQEKVVAAKAGGSASATQLVDDARKALEEARSYMADAMKNLKSNNAVANENWKKAAKLLSDHIDRITPLADANPKDQPLQKLAEEMSMRLYSCNKYQSLQ